MNDRTDQAMRDGMHELARQGDPVLEAHAIKLGERVGDTLTGFAGVATARIERLHGPTQYLLEAPAGNMDASFQKGQSEWFDEARLVIIDEEAPVNPELEERRASEREQDLLAQLTTVQSLLDRTICSCTLAKKCPQHADERPSTGRE